MVKIEKIKAQYFCVKIHNQELSDKIKNAANSMGVEIEHLAKSVIYDTVQSHPENMRKENKGFNIKE